MNRQRWISAEGKALPREKGETSFSDSSPHSLGRRSEKGDACTACIYWPRGHMAEPPLGGSADPG